MERRDFLKVTGLGAAGLLLPCSRLISAQELVAEAIPVEIKKRLADAALQAARDAGASYCDVRIGRYLRQVVATREDKVQGVVNTESTGCGVRVIVDGAWGFSATNALTADGVAAAARQAAAIARANATGQREPVQLAPQKGLGEVAWKAPIRKNAMEVPVKEKVELLLAANAAAMKAGASFVNSAIMAVNEQKYFASSDGSYIDQDIHRIASPMSATAVDKATGKFRTRAGLSSPMGMGYEYLDGLARDKVRLPTGTVVYDRSYDLVEDAAQAARDAIAKLKAPSVKPGKYDLILDPSHMWLTIHESIGHPTELDRVLGYEANYAGTSFVTLDKVRERFQYGNDMVTVTADKTERDSLGAVGYDDEGVPTQKWDIIRDGKLVSLQAIRDQAHMLGLAHSQGCCYADSWSSVQFQRMPNVSLQPGKASLTPADLVKATADGIYIIGNGSFSIDQQRYNAQFGGQLFFEVKDGRITRQIEDVAYQIRTPEFWNSCAGVCDQRDYRLGGSFNDGKGQPGQSSAVSHGSATSRWTGVNVINTARNLG